MIRRTPSPGYDENGISAAIVATGQGHIADSILRLAKENDIPLHHDADLLTILRQLDCGIVVPPRRYDALAQVLAACYVRDSNAESGTTGPARKS